MTTTVDAIYEHGKLLLPKPLSLPEKTRVRVTIESDTERETWLKLSEETLTKNLGQRRRRRLHNRTAQEMMWFSCRFHSRI